MNPIAKLLVLLCLLPFSLAAMAEDDAVELLTNGACDGTFNGWEQINYSDEFKWAIYNEEDGTKSWVSPYYKCTLRQTIDLAEKNISAEAVDNGEVWLKGSAQTISTDVGYDQGAYIAQVTVEMLDAKDSLLKEETVLGDVRIFRSWITFNKTFQLVNGTRKVSVVIEGEAFSGDFGPRFRNISLSRTEQPREPHDYVELLTNGACDGTFDGWTPSHGQGSEWDIRDEGDGSKSWISSFDYCSLTQTIDLAEKNVIADVIDNGEVWLKASAKLITTRSQKKQGARVAAAVVDMLDAEGNILETYTIVSDTRIYDNWTTFDGIFPLAAGTHKLRFMIQGKDAARWNGNFGPRFRKLSLAIDKNAIYSRADVNRDADINTTDVVAIYAYIERGDDSGFTREDADVNGDTDINTSDVVAVYDIIINGDVPPTPPEHALPYTFSVSSTKTVLFADGNLQYINGIWRFASRQYEYFGADQSSSRKDMFAFNSYSCPRDWYCLTNDEWTYLLSERTVSNTLCDGALYTLATIGNTYKGMIVFPDKYTHPGGAGFTAGTYNAPSDFTATVSLEDWALMEKAGAMFLPCAGYKSMGSIWRGLDEEGSYMTTTASGSSYYDPLFSSSSVNLTESSSKSTWSSVRLVRSPYVTQ